MSSLDQIGNVIGFLGGQALNAVNLAANLEHGNLQGYLANRAQLGQDAASRQQIGQSPFFAGLAGYGMPGVDVANIHSGYGNEGQIINSKNLPPLTAQTQAEQAKAIREAQLQNLTPEQAAKMAEQARVGQPGGPSRLTIPTMAGNETFGGSVPALEFPTAEAAQSAGKSAGLVPVPTNRNTFVLRPPARQAAQGTASAEDLQALGLAPAPAQAPQQPQEAPAAPQGGEEAPSQPFTLPPGFTPFEGAPAVAAPQAPAPAEAPADQARVGFPSPAFVDQPAPSVVQNPQSIAQFEARTPRAGQAPMAQMAAPQAPAAVGPPPLAPGYRVTAKIAPGVTVSRSGPPQKPPDFSELASKRAIPLIDGAIKAIDNLTQKGVLTDDYTGIALNRARLEYQARKPKADPDAVFLIRNLRSAVPLLARGFGEQRTNQREEQRLSDALSFNLMSASAARDILTNYKTLFQTGAAPPALQQAFPDATQAIQGQFMQSLSPAQQMILQRSQPVGR